MTKLSPEKGNKTVSKDKTVSNDKLVNSSNRVRKKLSKGTIWTIKITIITLCLALVVSFVTEITSSKSNLIISVLVLCLLITISIIFDAIGVAATSCDLAPLLAMAAKKVKGAKIAVKLVKNAEKVANICTDVIGDMSGIISGTSTAAIVMKLAAMGGGLNTIIINIILVSIVAAITVGGKAFFKTMAMNRSEDILIYAGKIIEFFYRPKQ